MKVMFLSIFASLFLLSSVAYADFNSLVCELDSRPVDGPKKALKLVKNDQDTYDATYLVEIAAAEKDEPKTVTIAKNLDKCGFSKTTKLLVNCTKLEKEEGEKSNSAFFSTKVKEESVKTNGEDETKEFFIFRVYSPQLKDGKPADGFPTTERGTFTITFDAKHCQTE